MSIDRAAAQRTKSPRGDILSNLGNIREGFLEVAWLGCVSKNKERLAQWKWRARTLGLEPEGCALNSGNVKESSATGSGGSGRWRGGKAGPAQPWLCAPRHGVWLLS